MKDLEAFEKMVRIRKEQIAPNRTPTEDELKEACLFVRPMFQAISDEDVENIIKRLQSVFDVDMDTGVSVEKTYEPWLTDLKGKQSSNPDYWYYWNRYVKYLDENMQRPSNIIASIDYVSDRIVDLAGNPKSNGSLHRRGLIIGDVQSGKTANYIAIMNKAADVGYKVIVLLTGTIESLRRQTQERVDEGFIGRSSKAFLNKSRQTVKKGVGLKDSRRFATGFTTEASDFKTATLRSMNISLKNAAANEPVVLVLKKNSRTLTNLLDWLNDNKDSNGKINLPLLLIDDEADNASINTKEDDNPTAINKHIRTLLSMFTSSSYIAVTATPFANIFILPEKTEEMENDDLFPSNYIYALDAPTNYIGCNEIFGDNATFGSSLVTIDDADSCFPYKHKQHIPVDTLPESLYEALRYFVLANIVRDVKGDVDAHRSMLVNVSRFTVVQDKVSERIKEWLFEVKRDIQSYCMMEESIACQNPNINKFREMWNDPKYPFFNNTHIAWGKIQKEYLMSAAVKIEVRTINQKSSSKILDYAEYEDGGLRVIAVGGLSLSRGLTLEGLMVSYFHRNSQMYDTLMQMGRWFGYREGYKELFRIWMPDDAIGWYSHITSASNELREEILRMNRIGAEPKDFGLKVRAHPTTLIITAKNKMKHSEKVERWITLDGEFFETPRFQPSIDVIRNNRRITDEIVQKIITTCGDPVGSGKQPLFWNNVPAEIICEFLRRYNSHPMNMEANADTLQKYISANSQFATWDVLITTNKNTEESHSIGSCSIHPTKRPFADKPVKYSAYGTKLRIGTMGLTKHGLSKSDRTIAEEQFRELKRGEYEKKYGDEAEEKLNSMNFPDRAYLIKGRHPILIIHYLVPDTENEKCCNITGFDMDNDLLVGYGMGFPSSAGSEPTSAVYYLNLVEQRKYMDVDDEMEEDQFDDDE